MQKVSIILAALGLALGAGIVVHERNSKPSPAKALSLRERDELSEMKKDVGALRGELRATVAQTQLVDRAMQRVNSVREAEPSQAVEEPVEPSSPEEDRARSEAAVMRIAQSFQAEVADRQWSSKVEAEIRAALKDDLIKLNAKSVECRSETCRLELDGNEPGAQIKGLPMIANRLGATLPSTMGHEESDGRRDPHGSLPLPGRVMTAAGPGRSMATSLRSGWPRAFL